MSKLKNYDLLGNRLLVEVPNSPKTKIEVDSNTKEALQKEMLLTLGDLKIVAVGSQVDHLKKGDRVLVDPGPLTKAPKIPQLSTDEVTIVLISPFDIILKWLN